MALSKSEVKSVIVQGLKEHLPEKSAKEIDAVSEDLCDRLITEYAGEIYEDDSDDEEMDGEDSVDSRLAKFVDFEEESEEEG